MPTVVVDLPVAPLLVPVPEAKADVNQVVKAALNPVGLPVVLVLDLKAALNPVVIVDLLPVVAVDLLPANLLAVLLQVVAENRMLECAAVLATVPMIPVSIPVNPRTFATCR